jgi:hypothetical protein
VALASSATIQPNACANNSNSMDFLTGPMQIEKSAKFPHTRKTGGESVAAPLAPERPTA